MNTLFWFTLFLNGLGGLYGVATGIDRLLNQKQSFGSILVRLCLGGAFFTLLAGTYKLYSFGFQSAALWITVTLWLMMLVSASAFLLVNLGERKSESTLPQLTCPVRESQLSLENTPVCA